jgi:hypothetical protein
MPLPISWNVHVGRRLSGPPAYAIMFDREFAETPTVVATIIGDNWNLVDNVHVAEVSTEKVVITTGDYYGSYGDRPFSFIATA